VHSQDSYQRTLFQLKPLKVARVSEISEATASSATAPEDRVNFHIGNPVQDKRLMAAYLRMALGIDVRREDLDGEDVGKILEQLEWSDEDRSFVDFLKQLIQKSCPYSPRGGFSRNAPHSLITSFTYWLQTQQEPLSYDLGQTSGKREVVLSTGGKAETLRVLYHALSTYIVYRPVAVLLWEVPLPNDESLFTSLQFSTLTPSEQDLIPQLQTWFLRESGTPVFLVVGKELGEETRRRLRHLSIQHPLFFIEVNDAPNHLSLAREAKLVDRVLRLLTPGIFTPHFQELATIFFSGSGRVPQYL